MGLREIKKQLTRESIAEAALQLALDHGLEQVTIEEIARVVFISPRTVSNYFSCKEEAIVAAGLQDSHRLLEDFAERPAAEPSLQSLCELLVNIAKGRSPEQQQLALRKIELAQRYPVLLPFEALQYAQLEEGLREAIARREGSNLNSDVSAWLTAAAAVTAIRYSVAIWVARGGQPDDMAVSLQEAFDQIRDQMSATEPVHH